MCLEIEMFCFFTETNATVVRTICYYRIDATHTTFQVNTTRATQSNHGTQFNSHIALDANQCNSHNLRNSTQPNNATYSTFTIITRRKTPTSPVDRPTQLICISDIYLLTYKYTKDIAGQSATTFPDIPVLPSPPQPLLSTINTVLETVQHIN